MNYMIYEFDIFSKFQRLIELYITHSYEVHKCMKYTDSCITQNHVIHKVMYYTKSCDIQNHKLHKIT